MEPRYTLREFEAYREYQELKRQEVLRQQEQPSLLGNIISGIALLGAFTMGMDIHHFLTKD